MVVLVLVLVLVLDFKRVFEEEDEEENEEDGTFWCFSHRLSMPRSPIFLNPWAWAIPRNSALTVRRTSYFIGRVLGIVASARPLLGQRFPAPSRNY